MQSNGTPYIDGSVPVPLKIIDSDADNEGEFPRLDALQSDPEDASKFVVTILNTPGGTSQLRVSTSDTIADIKRRTIRVARARELARIEFAGETLDDERTMSDCGIVSGSELVTLWNGDVYEVQPQAYSKPIYDEEKTEVARGIGRVPEATKRGLVNKARAQVLYEWDGIMPDGMLGLPLDSKGFVMIGRVVNKDWYEGYLPDNLNKCGYVPRNYVEIESVYDEAFRSSLGPDGKESPLSSPEAPPPSHHGRDCLDRIFHMLSRKNRKEKQLQSPAKGLNPRNDPVPPIPPSPFPPKPLVPIWDLFEQGSRVRLNFNLIQHEGEEHSMITAILSLVSAPQSRVSYATVELQFEHDTIVALEPKREECTETEVHHSNSVGHELSITGGASQVPVNLNIGATHSQSKVAEFSRRTRGMITGDGEGTSTAYWVFKEDPGEAGRSGLSSEQKMMVRLHMRPVRVDYQVNTKVVMDDGGTGGWFGTKRLSSGRQSFYFPA